MQSVRAGVSQWRALWAASRGDASDSLPLPLHTVDRAIDSVCICAAMAAAASDVFLAAARSYAATHPALAHQRPARLCNGDADIDPPLCREDQLPACPSWG